jgi:hypothetical protein
MEYSSLGLIYLLFIFKKLLNFFFLTKEKSIKACKKHRFNFYFIKLKI